MVIYMLAKDIISPAINYTNFLLHLITLNFASIKVIYKCILLIIIIGIRSNVCTILLSFRRHEYKDCFWNLLVPGTTKHLSNRWGPIDRRKGGTPSCCGVDFTMSVVGSSTAVTTRTRARRWHFHNIAIFCIFVLLYLIFITVS